MTFINVSIGAKRVDLILTGCTLFVKKLLKHIQSNFGRSNSPVSNTRDRSDWFVGPGNSPIHLMLKYTPGSNSDGSNCRTQSTVRRAIFSCKNAMMARTKYFFT